MGRVRRAEVGEGHGESVGGFLGLRRRLTSLARERSRWTVLCGRTRRTEPKPHQVSLVQVPLHTHTRRFVRAVLLGHMLEPPPEVDIFSPSTTCYQCEPESSVS